MYIYIYIYNINNHDNNDELMMIIIITSVQGNLAKGLIAVLSPLTAANALVRRVRWAGTFASGGWRTTRNALMRRYGTMDWHMSPSKCPFQWEYLDPT